MVTSNHMNELTPGLSVLFYALGIWSLIWRGLALWRAAKQSQRNWFIVLLVLNTVGLLEIVYLFRFSHKKMTIKEIQLWFKKTFFTRNSSK